MTISEFKAAAAERGIEWASLRALYDSMRAQELEPHERRKSMIGAAFKMLGQAHGGRFKLANRHEFAGGGDYTSIPGFDVVAASMAAEYPDLLPQDDSAGELWALLTEPAPEPPAAADTMLRALERGMIECPAVPGTPRDLVSTAEAATLANVSEVWMRRLVRSGKVYGKQVGKCYFVSAAAATRFQRHPTAGRPRGESVDLTGVLTGVPF